MINNYYFILFQSSTQTLTIDITKKKVSIDDEEIALTKKEFEILFLLLQNKGRVFSREDILARIWSDEVYVLDRTIDVNITRLRKKIGIYGCDKDNRHVGCFLIFFQHISHLES